MFVPYFIFRIYSGGNDHCVIARDVEMGVERGGPTGVFLHYGPVYGIDASPEGPGGCCSLKNYTDFIK